MSEHDDVLQRHRARFEAHRNWLKQQQSAIARDATSPPPPHVLSGRQTGPQGSPHRQRSPVRGPASQGPAGPAYGTQQRQVRQSAAAAWVDEGLNYAGTADRAALSQDRVGLGGFAPRTSHASQPSPYEPAGLADMRGDDAHHHNHSGGNGFERSGSHPSTDILLSGSPLHVYSRSTQWARRKQQRLDELRVAAVDREMHDCSFRPDTSTARVSAVKDGTDASAAASIYSAGRASDLDASGNTVEVVSGYQSFIARKLRAQEMRQDKERRLRSDGSRWTGAATVVEAFNLGRYDTATNDRKLQRVLKPPVAAPHKSTLSRGANLPPQGGFSAMRSAGAGASSKAAGASSSPFDALAAAVTGGSGGSEDGGASPLPPKGIFSIRGASNFVSGVRDAEVAGSRYSSGNGSRGVNEDDDEEPWEEMA